ncbi:MAG: hypothetical protein KAS71_03980 [Bacteroidales bacterium]|nr:hypothetical protein [Bacteroidales bacterium]
MKEEKRKFKLGESGFWPTWSGKLLFTLISVKVWGLIASMSISSWLLFLHYRYTPVVYGDKIIEFGINGAQWVSFNTTIWALIFGMKEIFRIAEQRDYAEMMMFRKEYGKQSELNKVEAKKPGNEFAGEKQGREVKVVGEEPPE